MILLNWMGLPTTDSPLVQVQVHDSQQGSNNVARSHYRGGCGCMRLMTHREGKVTLSIGDAMT